MRYHTGILISTQCANHPVRMQSDRQQQSAALSEPGAWLCSTCGNHNFASRNVCNSKTCDARRPFDQPRPPQQRPAPRRPPRHDPKTSKQLVWAEQADKATLEKNQVLRKRYLEHAEDMDTEEIERAKILIARDERKKRKKEQRKEKSLMRNEVIESPLRSSSSETASKHTTFVVKTEDEVEPKRQKPRKDATTTSKSKVNRKMQREVKRRNKELRIQYLNGGANGMNPADAERAKALIARDERKRAKKRSRGDEEQRK